MALFLPLPRLHNRLKRPELVLPLRKPVGIGRVGIVDGFFGNIIPVADLVFVRVRAAVDEASQIPSFLVG